MDRVDRVLHINNLICKILCSKIKSILTSINKKTVTEIELETSINLTFNGELRQKCIEQGRKSIENFTNYNSENKEKDKKHKNYINDKNDKSKKTKRNKQKKRQTKKRKGIFF